MDKLYTGTHTWTARLDTRYSMHRHMSKLLGHYKAMGIPEIDVKGHFRSTGGIGYIR